jgi:hypothetical protein
MRSLQATCHKIVVETCEGEAKFLERLELPIALK